MYNVERVEDRNLPTRLVPKEVENRVVACFKALATGDAVAKQTETLPYAAIRQLYPEGIRGFEGPVGNVIPRYRGKRYEWKIGETTDDTEQTLAVARALLEEETVTHSKVGEKLLECTKSVHPDTSIWSLMQERDATRVAQSGDGCGAAMRVSPVGILYRSSDLDSIVRGAYECTVPTHGGQSAICAAAAVAAAISAALDGFSARSVLATALAASRMAESLRPATRACSIADSIAKMHEDLSSSVPLGTDFLAERYFPNTPETIVPLAINLALITQSAEHTTLIAANLGGDSDSVASIGSGIAAALRPETVNEAWFDVVNTFNQDRIVPVALSLAALRGRLAKRAV